MQCVYHLANVNMRLLAIGDEPYSAKQTSILAHLNACILVGSHKADALRHQIMCTYIDIFSTLQS